MIDVKPVLNIYNLTSISKHLFFSSSSFSFIQPRAELFEVSHTRVALLQIRHSEPSFYLYICMFPLSFLSFGVWAEASVFDLRNCLRNPKRIGILIYPHNKLQNGFIKSMAFCQSYFSLFLSLGHLTSSVSKKKKT